MGALLRWTNLANGETLFVRTAGPVARPEGGLPLPSGATADAELARDRQPLNYWIQRLAPGRYGVRVTAPGYYPLMLPIVDVAPGAQRIDFGPLEPLPVRPAPATAVSDGAGSDSAEDLLGGAGRPVSTGEPGTADAIAGTYNWSFVTWQLPPPPSVNRNAYFDVVFTARNTGSTAWTWGYGSERIWVRFIGTGFSVVRVLPYTATVAPGGYLSIRVTLRAPGYAGNQRVQFILTKNGAPFGYGSPSANVYVR
jgi:hypothetical protein